MPAKAGFVKACPVGIEPTLRGLESLVLPLYEGHKSCLGVTPFAFQNVSRRRVSRVHTFIKHSTQLVLNCRSEEVLPIASDYRYILFPHFYHGYYAFRISYCHRYHEVGPASQPRFELGLTDSESVVLPVTPKGNKS